MSRDPESRSWMAMIVYVGCVCICAQPCLTLVTPWTAACQLPLSMEFSRQEYWNGMPFSSPLCGGGDG